MYKTCPGSNKAKTSSCMFLFHLLKNLHLLFKDTLPGIERTVQLLFLAAILDLRHPSWLLMLHKGFILIVVIRNELFVVQTVDIDHLAISNLHYSYINKGITRNGGHFETDAILTYFRPFLGLAPCGIQFVMSKNPHMQIFIILAQKLPPQLKNHFYEIWNLTINRFPELPCLS